MTAYQQWLPNREHHTLHFRLIRLGQVSDAGKCNWEEARGVLRGLKALPQARPRADVAQPRVFRDITLRHRIEMNIAERILEGIPFKHW